MVKGKLLIHLLWNVVIAFSISFFFFSCQKKSETDPVPKVTSSLSVGTIAGSGSRGFADGTGNASSFFMTSSLAIDASGNIYISDAGNGIIRKMNKSGDVKTFAGTAGVHTSILGYPYGIAADASGNLYVGDVYHDQIRKITPTGVISTFAGSGSSGFDNGPAATASFNAPYGIAVDVAGNVYVADAGNNAIRKITPEGIVTTLAGSGAAGMTNGIGTQATFFSPYGIAVDAAGNVFVGDTYNRLIRKITPDGMVSTVAGGGTINSDTPGFFGGPFGIALDASGNLYVADFGLNQIRKVSTSGAVTVLAGSGQKGSDNGPGDLATFDGPSGIAVDEATGNIYVADYRNNKIRIVFLSK
jgi:serine/threonine-protein kinase